MTILYSVVARGTTILARFASCTGNFAEVAEQILRSIAPENAKLTYTHSRSRSETPLDRRIKCELSFLFFFILSSYLFHYISEDGIVYLCITTDVSPPSHVKASIA